jgi:hypothetical protein
MSQQAPVCGNAAKALALALRRSYNWRNQTTKRRDFAAVRAGGANAPADRIERLWGTKTAQSALAAPSAHSHACLGVLGWNLFHLPWPGVRSRYATLRAPGRELQWRDMTGIYWSRSSGSSLWQSFATCRSPMVGNWCGSWGSPSPTTCVNASIGISSCRDRASSRVFRRVT